MERNVSPIVSRRWSSLPPVMERTLRDDLKWVLALLAGAMLGYLVLGVDGTSPLLGFVVGAAVVLCVLALVRRVRQRRRD